MAEQGDATLTDVGPDDERAAEGGDGAAERAGEEPGTQAPPRLRARRGALKGLLDGLLKPPAPVSGDDAEREAAHELHQAIAPAMDRLVLAVPGAGGPEDALARLEADLPPSERSGEPPPADYLPHPEMAHTLALYQVRRHLKNYRFPTAHERELAARLNVRTRSPSSS